MKIETFEDKLEKLVADIEEYGYYVITGEKDDDLITSGKAYHQIKQLAYETAVKALGLDGELEYDPDWLEMAYKELKKAFGIK